MNKGSRSGSDKSKVKSTPNQQKKVAVADALELSTAENNDKDRGCQRGRAETLALLGIMHRVVRRGGKEAR